jgi:hypothetical protein
MLGTSSSNALSLKINISDIYKFFVITSSDSASVGYVSPDAINWTEKTLPEYLEWSDSVLFNNNLSIFTRLDNEIYTTSNFSSFTNQNTSYSTIYDAAHGPNMVVATQNLGMIYSVDGLNWDTATIPEGYSPYLISYGNGKFIMVPVSASVALVSNTGNSSYVESVLPNEIDAYGIAFGNNTFIITAIDAIGFGIGFGEDPVDNSYYFRSIDNGNSWTKQYFPNSDINPYYLTFGNNKFLAISQMGSKGYVSNNGIDWTEISIPINNVFNKPIYQNGLFVIFEYYSNNYATSLDGVTWVLREFPVSFESQVWSIKHY